MVGIYKITNCINGHCYIGQSVDIRVRFNQHKRAAFDKKDKKYDYPLYRAIRKYGLDNFSFEILEECSASELNEKEIFYIDKYGAYGKNGYNQDKGGNNAQHYIKLSDDLVGMIINRLRNSLDDSEDIGKEFNVSGRTIRGINTGKCCRQDSITYPIRPPLWSLEENSDKNDGYKIKQQKTHNCQACGKIVTKNAMYCEECAQKNSRKVQVRPEPIELAGMIKQHGFNKTGDVFGVSSSTIKKWCRAYGIPTLKDDVILWYNEKLGIEESIIIKEEKTKTIQEKRVKQIDQYTNEIINIFNSENDAARYLGKNKGNHIGEACKGKLNVVYGFKWSYDE